MLEGPNSTKDSDLQLFAVRLSTNPGYVLLGGGREGRPLLVQFAWGDSLSRLKVNVTSNRESIMNAVQNYGQALRVENPEISFAIQMKFPVKLQSSPVVRNAGFNGFGQSNFLHVLQNRPYLLGRWSQKQFPTDMTLTDDQFRLLKPS